MKNEKRNKEYIPKVYIISVIKNLQEKLKDLSPKSDSYRIYYLTKELTYVLKYIQKSRNVKLYCKTPESSYSKLYEL